MMHSVALPVHSCDAPWKISAVLHCDRHRLGVDILYLTWELSNAKSPRQIIGIHMGFIRHDGHTVLWHAVQIIACLHPGSLPLVTLHDRYPSLHLSLALELQVLTSGASYREPCLNPKPQTANPKLNTKACEELPLSSVQGVVPSMLQELAWPQPSHPKQAPHRPVLCLV